MSAEPATHEARFPAFLALWGSQTLSLFGTMISQLAVNVWLVRDLYPDPAQKPALALALTATGIVAGALRFPAVTLHASEHGNNLLDDVRAGFRWILSRRPFLALIAIGGVTNFTFAPLLLSLPLLARDRVHADAAARHLSFEAVLALVNTAGGLGGVLGGVAISTVGLRNKHRIPMVVACIAVLGVGQMIAGLATTVGGLALGMFVGELLIAPLNTGIYTLWQSLTPPHMLARALATRRFISQSAFPVGTAVAGWIAVAVEPWLVVTLSGAVLALSMGALLLQPGFRTLEERMREAAARPG